jgi:hypothetical protein
MRGYFFKGAKTPAPTQQCINDKGRSTNGTCITQQICSKKCDDMGLRVCYFHFTPPPPPPPLKRRPCDFVAFFSRPLIRGGYTRGRLF